MHNQSTPKRVKTVNGLNMILIQFAIVLSFLAIILSFVAYQKSLVAPWITLLLCCLILLCLFLLIERKSSNIVKILRADIAGVKHELSSIRENLVQDRGNNVRNIQTSDLQAIERASKDSLTQLRSIENLLRLLRSDNSYDRISHKISEVLNRLDEAPTRLSQVDIAHSGHQPSFNEKSDDNRVVFSGNVDDPQTETLKESSIEQEKLARLVEEYTRGIDGGDRAALRRLASAELNITCQSEDALTKGISSERTKLQEVGAGGSYLLIPNSLDDSSWIFPTSQTLRGFGAVQPKMGVFRYVEDSVTTPRVKVPALVVQVGGLWEVIEEGIILVPQIRITP